MMEDEDQIIERITLAALGLASPEETERVRDLLSRHPDLAARRAAAEWHTYDWTARYSRRKRLIDVTIAALLMVILLPILAILSALLLAGQWSFPIYRRTVIGKGGIQLNVYRFKCMYTSAPHIKRKLKQLINSDGPAFKIDHDPRFTRTGRWVHKCGLMDLPALYNVISRGLSLVGPSPAHYITSTYVVDEQPAYFKRFAVFPGLFSLRNILGKRTERGGWAPGIATSIDLYYVRNASISLDIKILVASVLTLFRIPRTVVISMCRLPSLESIVRAETDVEPEMMAAYDRFSDVYRRVLDPSKWISLDVAK